MTTIVEARAAAYARMLDQWSGTPLAQVTFENEAATALDGGTLPWVRLTVRSLAGGQESLGPVGVRKYERVGRIVAQLFTPAERAGTTGGMAAGDALAQEVLTIFEGTSFAGLHCNDGQVTEDGQDGRWYQHRAEVDFFYEEQK